MRQNYQGTPFTWGFGVLTSSNGEDPTCFRQASKPCLYVQFNHSHFCSPILIVNSQLLLNLIACWINFSAVSILKYMYLCFAFFSFSFFFFFLHKRRFDISCKSSPREMVCMKCLSLFLIFFAKAYVVGTHLNCIDKLMQFK